MNTPFYLPSPLQQNNTFQVVVVTDGLFSFTIFNYAKLTWVTGDDIQSGGTDGFGGTAAMVGINAGDGINFKKFQHSLTDRVVEVLEDTNMANCNDPALKGQYVYQIDTVPIISEKNCKDPSRPPTETCSPGRFANVRKCLKESQFQFRNLFD